jgi:light-regulated signal transduction histidine kinase (bacteriophytochrome)
MENLLGNAWKYTSKIDEPEISFGRCDTDKGGAFYVRDNGAGFDMELAGDLFKPFVRLHSSKDFPGTGIGLATVQRIIDRHRGSVWAEGVVAKGATFYFILPEVKK